MDHSYLLLGALFIVAFLYSSVGHGGASGYIAVLTMAGFAVSEIRPFVLMLNIIVSLLAFYQFTKAGYFQMRLSWPLIMMGIPFSYFGGSLHLKATTLSFLIGVILLFSASRLFWSISPSNELKTPSIPLSLSVGGGLGFLAGLTGTGGGIFLTPLLILKGWASPKNAAATSALFILMNSIAGLAGFFNSNGSLGTMRVEWIVVVYLGGLLGSTLGSRFFSVRLIRVFLGIVLLIASVKLLSL